MQRIIYDFASVSLRHKAERMVYRRLDDYLFIFFEQGVYGHSDTLDNTRNEGHPIPFNLPLMVVFYPSHDCRPVFLRLERISVQRMLETFLQGICNEIRSLEVHVRHP